MKRGTRLYIMGMILSLLIVGCSNNEQSPSQMDLDTVYNEAFEKYAKEQVLGMIINEPDSEVLEGVTQLETYSHIEEGEKLLIVPKYNGSAVTVQQVQLEGEEWVVKEVLYSKEKTESQYGLLLETIRPEGIPELMVTIIAGENRIDYLVSYNGKEGTPPIEYLTLLNK